MSATGGGGGATDAGATEDGGAPDGGVTDGGVTDAGDGGHVDGGGADGGAVFVRVDLDPSAREATFLAMAVDPVLERVGVAYFTPRGTETTPGTPDYDIKYVEWKQGAIVTPPQTVRFVQRKVGIALAFNPSTGEPVLAYLGGAAGAVMGEPAFWFQSDAVINQRTNGATWTETVIATTGNQVSCGNPVSDRGLLVGLWPALAYDSTGKLYFAYRDGHDGQFPMQDWSGSDVEIWEGVPGGAGVCGAQGGNNKDAYGGHLQMVIGPNDQPAIIHDQMFGTSDGTGNNVIFQRRTAAGWNAPSGTLLNVSDTQTGASLAYEPTEGFGVAVFDRSSQVLSYGRSANGANWTFDTVPGVGSRGWYPSLAIDPLHHEPVIASYRCSQRANVTTACLTTEDSLIVTQRVAGSWLDAVVDPSGGWSPKVGFFATGKRVVAYRVPPAIDPSTGAVVPTAGVVRLAIEQ